MSDKQWKRVRMRIKGVYHNWEIALKAGMKIPWYIRFFGLFKKQIKSDWVRRWEKKNKDMMDHALKQLAHELEGER